MRILVTKGPNAGQVLDYSTRQAESALASGWATVPPAVDEIPAASPAVVEVVAEESVAENADVEPAGVADARPRKRRGRA